MMRRVWLAFLLVASGPVSAQSDSTRIAALEARVAMLDSILGTKGFLAPTIPCDQMESRRPTWNFPNGEYATDYRTKQFGCFANGVVANITGLQAQVAGLASRVAGVESRSGLGRTVRADSLILGTCLRTDIASQLAVCGQGDANIHVESNISSTQYQNPSPHVGMWSLSGDGGLRIIQNGYATTACFLDVDPTNGVTYTNCLKRFVDPTREVGIFGPDSRANFSWSRTSVCQLSDAERTRYGIPTWVTPIPCPRKEYTQDAVMIIDPEMQRISIESWQSNWRWEFIRSTCRTCRDIAIPIQ